MNDIGQSSSSGLRIAYFIDDLIHGGTQTWLNILVEGLHNLGYQQRIYCMRNRTHPQNVQRLVQWANVGIVGEPRLWAMAGLIYLYKELKQWQPDIVQTLLPTSDMIGRSLGRVAGVPIVVSSIRNHNLNKPWWQLFLDRRTAPWAKRIIFNSRYAIPFALAHEGVTEKQVVYIPNGARRWQPTTGADAMRAQLNIPEQYTVLGMVARLHPQKGHNHLLTAYALARPKLPSTALLIIGDGPLRGTLQHQATRLGIAAHVRFLGDRSDVSKLLSVLDIYVHSSLFEGMPNAVMEAMAAAKPIIATAVDGTQALIVNNQSGWLVEPGNPAALAERMIYALNHQAEAEEMGQAAADRIKTHFSADKMIAAYHRCYQELAKDTAC